MPASDVQPVRMGDQADETDDLVIVVERFSDPHQNDIGNAFPQIPLRGDDLTEQFARGQIPHLAAQRGRAEPAAHPATDLGGYADRQAVFIPHDDGFHTFPVIQGKKIFYGSVQRGDEFPDHGQRTVRSRSGQHIPRGFPDVGHLFRGETAVKLGKNLSGPVFRLAGFLQDGFQLFREQAQKIRCGGVRWHLWSPQVS